jgi:hypothetical protein
MGTGHFGKRHLEKIRSGYRKIIISQRLVYFYQAYGTSSFNDDF